MPAPNLTTVEIKAFVPAQDFAVAMDFYQALGFTRASVSDGIAYFHCGDCSFLLQDFYVRELAENFQMHLLVASADDWHAQARPVAERFGVAIGEPADRPWAMRDFTLTDPSGVLWRIAQNLPRSGSSAGGTPG
jgi:uncharacterized glyoxalase superfamily protein PhnB